MFWQKHQYMTGLDLCVSSHSLIFLSVLQKLKKRNKKKTNPDTPQTTQS